MNQDKDILVEIMQITDIKRLRLMKSAIMDRIKEVGSSIKHELRKGDKVYIDSPRKERTEVGIINKINITRAVVEIDGQLWNVPFTMIRKSKGDQYV
tara:strand:+ start:389 stop:679 length:291 start_codon:yes stop_codon:yes gene_type:complete